MFVKRPSNAFGCFFIASASEAPASTSARVARIVCEKFLSSSCVPRISRHCTRGRPASIITENWRVKTARFLAGTDLARNAFVPAAFAAFSFTGLMRVTRTCSRRNAATAASIVSAMCSPVTV
jgi:hypothetical protein